MIGGIGNLYLFSVFRDGAWSLITSTNRSNFDTGDVDAVLGIASEESRFVREMLFEDIASPLVVMREDGNELKPLIIVRSMLFETSMCIAIETDDTFLEVLRGDNGLILSPEALKYAELYNGRDRFDPTALVSSYNMAEFLSLLSFSPSRGIADACIFDDLIICVREILGLEIEVAPIDSEILSANSDGRIFLGGFSVCCFMAMAVSAKICSCDGRMKMNAICSSGHLVLKMSYSNGKKKSWGGCELLSEIADAYGVALAVEINHGETECCIIPERVDEALNGVKEGLISLFGYF